MRKHDPLKQIRKFCVECSGGSPFEAKYCSDSTCSLWYLRFGMRFRTATRNMDKDLFKPEHFGEDGKFSYLRTIGEIEGAQNSPKAITRSPGSRRNDDLTQMRPAGPGKEVPDNDSGQNVR